MQQPECEDDFARWAERTSRLLLERRFDEVDVERLAEEVRDLGIGQRLESISRLRVILMHLIKLAAHGSGAGAYNWEATLRVHRRDLLTMLELSPSLEPEVPRLLDRLYEEAREDVVDETGGGERIPRQCPFTVGQVLDLNYVPAPPE